MSKNPVHMAYCGFDCGNCPVYEATAKKDEKLKKELAEKYSTGGYFFVKDDMNCLGCKSDTVSKKMCSSCGIRICAEDKNIDETCAYCSEYPCNIIDEFLPKGTGTRDFLNEVNRDFKKRTVE